MRRKETTYGVRYARNGVRVVRMEVVMSKSNPDVTELRMVGNARGMSENGVGNAAR